jgi:hypothetical protein
MKRMNLLIIVVLVFMIINSCKPEFAGYECSSKDNKSTLQINDTYYSFSEEKVTTTGVIENDTNILIKYSITHYPVQTGSGNADNTIKDAISVDIVLIKENSNKITMDSNRSSVTFYELNNLGQLYLFSESNLLIKDYQTCDCGNELRIPEKSPNLFNAVLTGKIKHDVIIKNVNFQINFETKKVEVYYR